MKGSRFTQSKCVPTSIAIRLAVDPLFYYTLPFVGILTYHEYLCVWRNDDGLQWTGA